MADEFKARPFGIAGEFAIPTRPVITRVEKPLIPPPPWSENYDPALDPDHEPPLEPETSDEEDEQ
jgi:hypothetical protein